MKNLYCSLLLLLGILPGDAQAQSFTRLSPDVNLLEDYTPFVGKLVYLKGVELWQTDGTEAGTQKLITLPANAKGPLTAIGTTLYFRADGKDAANVTKTMLWKTDGTTQGTVQVKSLQGIIPGNVGQITTLGNTLLFFASTDTTFASPLISDFAQRLWRTDGTDAGTTVLTAKLGEVNALYQSDSLIAFNIGRKTAGLAAYGTGVGLYRTDGTVNGTQLINSLEDGSNSNNGFNSLYGLKNALYVSANDKIWRVGYSAGSSRQLIQGLNTGETYRILGKAGDRLFILKNRGTGTTYAGTDLMMLSGTDVTPTLVKSFTDATSFTRFGIGNDKTIALNNNLLFIETTNPGLGGTQRLWISDGTNVGTNQIRVGYMGGSTVTGRPLAVLNNYAYFTGDFLYRTDGTATNTVPLSTFSTSPGQNASIIAANNKIFFSANTGFWAYDPAGTANTCSLTVSANTPSTTLCTGTTAVLLASATNGTAPLTYQWTLNGTAISGATSATYTALAAGSYAVTVTDSKTCVATSSALTVSVVAPPANVTATNTGPYDAGQTIQLSASGGTAYAWKGPNGFTASTANPTIPNATTAQAGNYTVTVGTSSACPTVAATTTVTIRGALLPPTIVTSQSVVCAGSSVALTAQGCAGTVRWSSGQTGTSISVQPTTPTTYTAVCDADGRSSAASNAVTVGVAATPAVPSITSSSPQVIGGSSVTLTVGTGTTGSLQWLLGDAPIAGATQPAYVTTQAGTYSVRVTNASGCTAVSTTLTINLILAVEPVTSLSESQVTVYPNPTTGECWVRIEVDKKQPVTLHLTNALGQSVRQWTISATPKMQPIQVSLPDADGVYLLRVETEKNSAVKKVLRVN